MIITCTKQPESKMLISVTIPCQEQEPYLNHASLELSKKIHVAGFRSGHISRQMVEQQVGAMVVLETAAEAMIKKGMLQAIKEHSLETIGKPDVRVKKLVPENDVEIEITVSLIPHITLPELNLLRVNEKKIDVEESEVDSAVEELRNHRASEAATTNPARREDKVVIDMVLSIEHVAIEGGTAKNHSIYLNEESYIPGLTDKLVGSVQGEKRSFEIEFPKTHYSKLFAGKKVQCDVEINVVFERTLPELNDEFAKKFGSDSMQSLRSLITKNITLEKETKEHERAQTEMIEVIVGATVFEDIPTILIDAEKERLFEGLKKRLHDQGITMEDYLMNIKQTVLDVADGFKEQALARVKSSLVFRQLGEQEKINVTDIELENEIEKLRASYKNEPQLADKLANDDVRDYIYASIKNRKIIEILSKKMLMKETETVS